jgi:hypothetical protein
MVFTVLHDVLLCCFQKSLGPLPIMSLLWHVMQVTKNKKVQSLFFLLVKPPFYFFIVLNLELLNSSAFFLGCRLNLGPFTYVFSLFVDGQIWALCWSFISLLMVKHVGPFANHLSILVCWTRALLLIVFLLIVGQPFLHYGLLKGFKVKPLPWLLCMSFLSS